MNNKKIYILVAFAGITATVLNISNAAVAAKYDVFYGNLAFYAITCIASLITYIYFKKSDKNKKKLLDIGGPLNLLGGTLGAFVPIFIALGFLNLGAFITTMGVIGGQFLTSMIIDSKGWFGLPKLKMNKVKWLSVALIIAGVIIMTM
ncbi:MAG: DMT family transporter [Peptostreptococcaceae bacterium]|nr:DMT family transporter [Peptostreptococcaceae bacterium]